MDEVTNKKKNLYLVNLGGKANKSHIELHDIRWVIGDCIEDTFDQLRLEWFGSPKGLHIDSFIKIKYVDGYEINISENLSNQAIKCCINSSSIKNVKSKYKLWFVNLGGYDPQQLYEQHYFRLVVAQTSYKAKKIAHSKWMINNYGRHTDNIYSMKDLYCVDNCYLIKQIKNFSVNLLKDKLNRSQDFTPDWYGYKRIDKT